MAQIYDLQQISLTVPCLKVSPSSQARGPPSLLLNVSSQLSLQVNPDSWHWRRCCSCHFWLPLKASSACGWTGSWLLIGQPNQTVYIHEPDSGGSTFPRRSERLMSSGIFCYRLLLWRVHLHTKGKPFFAFCSSSLHAFLRPLWKTCKLHQHHPWDQNGMMRLQTREYLKRNITQSGNQPQRPHIHR